MGANVGRVDVAIVVRSNAPDADEPRTTLFRSTGSGINAFSEPSLALPIMIPLISPFIGTPVQRACRLRLGSIIEGHTRINCIVLADEKRVWFTKLTPRCNKITILIEHLDPLVLAVGDEGRGSVNRLCRYRAVRLKLPGSEPKWPQLLMNFPSLSNLRIRALLCCVR